MTLFLTMNGLFVAALIGLAIMQPPWWGWVLFVVLWVVADWFLAKDIQLAWWHWGLLVAALAVVDAGVLYATGQL